MMTKAQVDRLAGFSLGGPDSHVSGRYILLNGERVGGYDTTRYYRNVSIVVPEAREQFVAMANRLVGQGQDVANHQKRGVIYQGMDTLIDEMIVADVLNRKRRIAYLLQGQPDPREAGHWYNRTRTLFPMGTSFEHAVELLRTHRATRSENPRIWVKSRNDFVSVDDL